MRWLKTFDKSKTKVPLGVEKGKKANLSQAQGQGVINQHCVCFEWSKLVRWKCKICEVWIEKIDWVLSYIEFARKRLKMKNNYSLVSTFHGGIGLFH
jgi:hypothetical protein